MQVFVVSGDGIFAVKGAKFCYRLSCSNISPPCCVITGGSSTFSRSLVVPYLGFPSLFHNLSRRDPSSVMPYTYVRELANAVESSTRLVVQNAPGAEGDVAVFCHLTCSQRLKTEGQSRLSRYRFDLLLRIRRSQTGRGFMVSVRGRHHPEKARHNSRIATDYSTSTKKVGASGWRRKN